MTMELTFLINLRYWYQAFGAATDDDFANIITFPEEFWYLNMSFGILMYIAYKYSKKSCIPCLTMSWQIIAIVSFTQLGHFATDIG